MPKLYCILTLVFTVMFAAGCDQAPAPTTPSGKTIKVGLIAPLSGPDQAKGQEGLTGVEAVLKMTPLLQNGDKIELVIEDDQNDPRRAVNLFKKLVLEHQASAIVILSSSGPVLALASIADTYQTPILAAHATHPAITQNNGYVSQACFDDRFQGAVAALYVRDELLLDQVAVFSNPDSNYSSNLATEFERKFTDIGGRVIDQIFITENSEGLIQKLQELHNTGTELLYLPIRAADVIRIIKHTQKLNWHPQLMGSDGFLATIIFQYPDALPLLNGMLATDFFHNDMPLSPFGKEVKPHIKGLKTSYGALGIEAFAILLNAMNNCDPPGDKACINHRIRTTESFTGVLGNISIDANGRAARPLVINTIEEGRMRFVVKVY